MTKPRRVEESSPVAWAETAEAGAADLDDMREAARGCRACELWRIGTQTVFGEGAPDARIMLVGEQPGDREDRMGRPFVGPAGALLDRCLEAAGIDRREVYVTNAVKHFRWEARGKWRIHKKPRPEHVRACRPWLFAEIAAVRPRVVICLGATAAQTLLGNDFRVTQRRGEAIASSLAPHIVATVHPASLLRATDDATRHLEIERFTADLRSAAALMDQVRDRSRRSPRRSSTSVRRRAATRT